MLCLKARAKINWTLDILGRRGDGYHWMDMLMQSVSLCDTLWLKKSDTLSLEIAGPSPTRGQQDGFSAAKIPDDDNNLVLRAARALLAYGGEGLGAAIRLEKAIPSGAGMGGGSADAAAALIGLNSLWELGLSLKTLKEIGLGLGADIPFMLQGGLARVRGIGEELTPLCPAPEVWLVLWQPCDGLSTKEIFTAFDSLPGEQLLHPETEAAQQALLKGDVWALGRAMNNVLEAVSLEKRPTMGAALKELEALGAIRAMMTGSGSVVYGVFSCQENAEKACLALKEREGFHAVTHTEQQGILWMEKAGKSPLS